MNLIGIAIGATGLLLLGTFIWMLVLQMRKKIRARARRAWHCQAQSTGKNRQQEERSRPKRKVEIYPRFCSRQKAERMNKKMQFIGTRKRSLDNTTGMFGIVRLSENSTMLF